MAEFITVEVAEDFDDVPVPGCNCAVTCSQTWLGWVCFSAHEDLSTVRDVAVVGCRCSTKCMQSWHAWKCATAPARDFVEVGSGGGAADIAWLTKVVPLSQTNLVTCCAGQGTYAKRVNVLDILRSKAAQKDYENDMALRKSVRRRASADYKGPSLVDALL